MLFGHENKWLDGNFMGIFEMSPLGGLIQSTENAVNIICFGEKSSDLTKWAELCEKLTLKKVWPLGEGRKYRIVY